MSRGSCLIAASVPALAFSSVALVVEQAGLLEDRLGRDLECLGELLEHPHRRGVQATLELAQVRVRDLRPRRKLAKRELRELALRPDVLAERLDLPLPGILGHAEDARRTSRQTSSGAVDALVEHGGRGREDALHELPLGVEQLLGEAEARLEDLCGRRGTRRAGEPGARDRRSGRPSRWRSPRWRTASTTPSWESRISLERLLLGLLRVVGQVLRASCASFSMGEVLILRTISRRR